MSHKEIPAIAPHLQAAKDGVTIELSENDLRNLAGFFDVLIQMDFEQQLKQRIENEKNNIKDT